LARGIDAPIWLKATESPSPEEIQPLVASIGKLVQLRHCERSEAIQLLRVNSGLLRRFAPRKTELFLMQQG
jgi:hypothetical protein